MVTTFDPLNAYNLAETAAVNTINADAWLGDTENVALVHEKIRMGSDPYGLYHEHELPAIGVLAGGGNADDKHTIGEFEEYVRLTFDVWVASGEFDAADALCKQIVARLRSLMRIQDFSPAVNSASTQLDGFVTDGEISNEDYDFEDFAPDEEDGSSWLVHGVATTLIKLHSAT